MNNRLQNFGIGMTSLRTRERLVERLTEQGIVDVRVLEAIRDIPRHIFVEEALQSRAYEDLSLPIGNHQTISQPLVVAKMTEALICKDKLNSKPLKRVLEIGAGCGYQTAILSRFALKVKSYERIKPLYDRTKSILKKLNIKNVELIFGDCLSDLKEYEKFDGILSAAAAPEKIPDTLIKCLEIEGRLVLPVEHNKKQNLQLLIKKTDTIFDINDLGEVFFVPLVRGIRE
jgi:protein-L-isoaspartate(D-aspartate) O-methyltransferase|tara:strand:- start:66 stop:755 length:690 start_codon:yes stop_codon:yes gene_type:complete